MVGVARWVGVVAGVGVDGSGDNPGWQDTNPSPNPKNSPTSRRLYRMLIVYYSRGLMSGYLSLVGGRLFLYPF
jgi:hypothetical protein